jgi:hypothetical protein
MLRFHDLHGADYAAPVTGQRPVADRWWGERFPTRARVLACIASALALAACGMRRRLIHQLEGRSKRQRDRQ